MAILWKIHRGAKRQSDQSQLFPQNFQNNVENMFLHVLSVFKTDFHYLNTFSDAFLVGQSLVISSVFYVFLPLLHILVNCLFWKNAKTVFPHNRPHFDFDITPPTVFRTKRKFQESSTIRRIQGSQEEDWKRRFR